MMRKAPLSVGAFMLIGLAAGFFGATWHYSEHISLLEDEAKNVSPAAVGRLTERIGALEKQISTAIVPRDLSNHAKNIIKMAIERSKFKYTQMLLFTAVDPESLTYTTGIADFLKSENIQVAGPMVTATTLAQCGIMVGVPDVDHPSDQAKDFHFILDSANLSPKYTKWEGGPAEAFDLFIGPPCRNGS